MAEVISLKLLFKSISNSFIIFDNSIETNVSENLSFAVFDIKSCIVIKINNYIFKLIIINY